MGKPEEMDAVRTLRAIVQTERLVVDLEVHTEMLRRLIEEERGEKDANDE